MLDVIGVLIITLLLKDPVHTDTFCHAVSVLTLLVLDKNEIKKIAPKSGVLCMYVCIMYDCCVCPKKLAISRDVIQRSYTTSDGTNRSQLSVCQKLTILEDGMQNKNDPKMKMTSEL